MKGKSIVERHPHFAARVKDRIGDDVDPEWLYYRLIHSIERNDGWAKWKMLQKPQGASTLRSRHIYYFTLNEARYYAVVDVGEYGPKPVTILESRFIVRKKGSKKPRPLSGVRTSTGKIRGRRKNESGRPDKDAWS